MILKQVLKRNALLFLAFNMVMLPSCKPKNQNSKAKTIEQDSHLKGFTRVVFTAKGFRTVRRTTPDGNGTISKLSWVERGTEGDSTITAVLDDKDIRFIPDTNQIAQYQQYTGTDGKLRSYFLEGSNSIFVVGCVLPNGTKTIKVPKGPVDHPLNSQKIEIPIEKVQWLWELVPYNTMRAKLSAFNPLKSDLFNRDTYRPPNYEANMMSNKTEHHCAILAGPRDKENVVVEFRGLAQLKSDIIASNVDMIFGDNLYKAQKYVPFAVDVGRTVLSAVGGLMFFLSGGTLGPAIGMLNTALQGGNKTLDISKELSNFNDHMKNAHNKLDANTRKTVWVTSETLAMQALEVAIYQVQTSAEKAMETTFVAQLGLTPREQQLLKTSLMDQVRPEEMQEYEALRKKLREYLSAHTNEVLANFSGNFVRTFNGMKLDLAGIKGLFPKAESSKDFYLRIDNAWKKADIFKLFVMMEQKTDFTGTQFYNFAKTKLGDGYMKYAAEKIINVDIQDPRDPNSKFAQALQQSINEAHTSPPQGNLEMGQVALIKSNCSGGQFPHVCFDMPSGTTQSKATAKRDQLIAVLKTFQEKEQSLIVNEHFGKIIDQVTAQYLRLPPS